MLIALLLTLLTLLAARAREAAGENGACERPHRTAENDVAEEEVCTKHKSGVGAISNDEGARGR